jgi:hypothetical protein
VGSFERRERCAVVAGRNSDRIAVQITTGWTTDLDMSEE